MSATLPGTPVPAGTYAFAEPTTTWFTARLYARLQDARRELDRAARFESVEEYELYLQSQSRVRALTVEYLEAHGF